MNCVATSSHRTGLHLKRVPSSCKGCWSCFVASHHEKAQMLFEIVWNGCKIKRRQEKEIDAHKKAIQFSHSVLGCVILCFFFFLLKFKCTSCLYASNSFEIVTQRRPIHFPLKQSHNIDIETFCMSPYMIRLDNSDKSNTFGQRHKEKETFICNCDTK